MSFHILQSKTYSCLRATCAIYTVTELTALKGNFVRNSMQTRKIFILTIAFHVMFLH